MGQSVRTKNSTTILPSDDLKGSTALPSRSSAKARCDICGAPNRQIKNMTQIILSTDICEKYMAAGNLAPANYPNSTRLAQTENLQREKAARKMRKAVLIMAGSVSGGVATKRFKTAYSLASK